jgi:hypothetical protein
VAASNPAGFRQGIAATVPGTLFGSVPAAKQRLNEALARAVNALKEGAENAAAVLADLRATTVTGDEEGRTGAEVILGDELAHYEALIHDAAEAAKQLRGD